MRPHLERVASLVRRRIRPRPLRRGRFLLQIQEDIIPYMGLRIQNIPKKDNPYSNANPCPRGRLVLRPRQKQTGPNFIHMRVAIVKFLEC